MLGTGDRDALQRLHGIRIVAVAGLADVEAHREGEL